MTPTQFHEARQAAERSKAAKRERRWQAFMLLVDWCERPIVVLIVGGMMFALGLFCGAMIWRPLFGA